MKAGLDLVVRVDDVPQVVEFAVGSTGDGRSSVAGRLSAAEWCSVLRDMFLFGNGRQSEAKPFDVYPAAKLRVAFAFPAQLYCAASAIVAIY